MSEIYGGYDRGDSGGSYGNDDRARLLDTRSPADLDPHYYDGDITQALANDTGPNRFADDDDPDLENYARGLTPGTAWRNQGQPDSPDSRASYDQGDRPDTSQTSDPRDLWGGTDPDAANYADLYNPPASQNDRMADEGDLGPANGRDRDEEPDRGMDRAEYADYMRTRDSGTYAADDHDTSLDAENYANGYTPETSSRNEGSQDSPNGFGYLSDTTGQDRPAAQADDMSCNGEHPYPVPELDHTGELTSQADTNLARPDRSAETGDGLRQRVADLEAGNARLGNRNMELGEGMAALESENAQLGRDMADVRAENAELKADNAELRRSVSALEARMQHLERGGDDPSLTAMRSNGQDTASAAAEDKTHQQERPEWASNEALGLAAAVGGGILTTTADYWSYLPATYAGIAASAMGIGAATIGWYRKRKEVKDAAHRSQH